MAADRLGAPPATAAAELIEGKLDDHNWDEDNGYYVGAVFDMTAVSGASKRNSHNDLQRAN